MKEWIHKLLTTSIFDTLSEMNFGLRIIIAIIVFIIFWLFSLLIKKLFVQKLSSRFEEKIPVYFYSNLFRIIVVIAGALFALKIIGMAGIATSILAGAGISAFIIGFALKDIGENFLSGILLASNRPFRIGDNIECVNIKGKVVGLNLKHTEVKTADGKDVFIPNSILIKNPLYNYTRDGKLRHDINIIINNNVDINSLITRYHEILESNADHFAYFNHAVYIQGQNENGIELIIQFWVNTSSKINVSHIKTELLKLLLQ